MWKLDKPSRSQWPNWLRLLVVVYFAVWFTLTGAALIELGRRHGHAIEIQRVMTPTYAKWVVAVSELLGLALLTVFCLRKSAWAVVIGIAMVVAFLLWHNVTAIPTD